MFGSLIGSALGGAGGGVLNDFNKQNLFKTLLSQNNQFGTNSSSAGGGLIPNMNIPMQNTTPNFFNQQQNPLSQNRALPQQNNSGGMNGQQAMGMVSGTLGSMAQSFAQMGNNQGQQDGDLDASGGMAKSALGSVPFVGGLLGGIVDLFTGAERARRAEIRREAKVGHQNMLESYQLNKIKNNDFLKASDLYKNMLNNQNQSDL